MEGLAFLRELNMVSVCVRLCLAILCGGLIGLERERKRRPAGFRTYILVSLMRQTNNPDGTLLAAAPSVL